MKILITGGLGYIGSHTTVELIKEGYETVIVDDLSNSHLSVLEGIQNITGIRPEFYQNDLKDYENLLKVFKKENVDGVIHFAGFKAVGESVEKPLKYYENNIFSTINILKAMAQQNVNQIVFSSSATVYGEKNEPPFHESMPVNATNPYGQTKKQIEEMLFDYEKAMGGAISVLRYFNPIGAHESGFIGEKPQGYPNNLMPFVLDVAKKKRDKLNVFGDDYDTPDGTGLRDYIHVVDLARGHVHALKFLNDNSGFHIHNLGTGTPHSVLDVIQTFEKANGISIPYKIVNRRPGDIAASFANPSKAKKDLSWAPKYSLNDMCKHAWQFMDK